MDGLFNKQDVSQQDGPFENYSRVERSRSRSHGRSYSRFRSDYPDHYHSSHHRSRHHWEDYAQSLQPKKATNDSKLESYEQWKKIYGNSDRYYGPMDESELDNDMEGHCDRSSPVPVEPSINQDELDSRTIFVWQLSLKVQPCDLYEFFSTVGKIRDVRLIISRLTQRSKGVAYVEFANQEAAERALDLTGTRLLGVPIRVQPSISELSRILCESGSRFMPASALPTPMKLYVGSLHYSITEDMVRSIFEPFGRIDKLKLLKNGATGQSQGYGFITFRKSEDAKRAMAQLNGFEVAGRAMKVNYVVEGAAARGGGRRYDGEDTERTVIDLDRLALMAKLAEDTGFVMPKRALEQLHFAQQSTSSFSGGTGISASSGGAGSLPSPCFLLTNAFDSIELSNKPELSKEVQDKVTQECSTFGEVLHMYIDVRSSCGRVYVKCANTGVATQCFARMHGRYFCGRMVSASYVPLQSYHEMFPDLLVFKPMVVPPPT